MLQAFANVPNITLLRHQRNQGKGAALRDGFARAANDIVIVQDADLEYNPSEYPKLIQPILEDHADVVFGSRFVGGQSRRVLYFWHALGNRFVTMLSNMCTNVDLTDMETGYKVFRREVLERITIEEDRFGVEPELTAKVARLDDIRLFEVRHLVRGPDVQARQEDSLAGRARGGLVYPEVQPDAVTWVGPLEIEARRRDTPNGSDVHPSPQSRASPPAHQRVAAVAHDAVRRARDGAAGRVSSS